MTQQEILEHLSTYSTPELCDGAGAGEYRTMDYHIRRMVTEKRIIGRAYTVEVPEGISGIVPDAILEAKPGDILVIAAKGYTAGSFWGDHRSICATMKGIQGVVIDGAFRDIAGCEEAGVPIFARNVTPGSAGKAAEGTLNVPVVCGGIRVYPGDYLVGDENGIIVIRPEEAEKIMEKADEKKAAEEATICKMKATGEIIPRVQMGREK